MGIDPHEKKKHTNRRLKNGNRRERKLKAEIKELRQLIARTSNEIYQRKQQRKSTPKEKKIFKQLKETMNETKPTTPALMKHKEEWIDKLTYKRVKLVKMIKRGKIITSLQETRRISFKGLKTVRSMKELCQRWTSLLNFGEVSGKEMTVHTICNGWRKYGKS